MPKTGNITGDPTTNGRAADYLDHSSVAQNPLSTLGCNNIDQTSGWPNTRERPPVRNAWMETETTATQTLPHSDRTTILPQNNEPPKWTQLVAHKQQQPKRGKISINDLVTPNWSEIERVATESGPTQTAPAAAAPSDTGHSVSSKLSGAVTPPARWRTRTESVATQAQQHKPEAATIARPPHPPLNPLLEPSQRQIESTKRWEEERKIRDSQEAMKRLQRRPKGPSCCVM